MKIFSDSIVLELPETIEEGSAKILCDKPYYIERLEKNGEVIWFGFNTNWKRVNGKWYELIGKEFVECETPEYEKYYNKLK